MRQPNNNSISQKKSSLIIFIARTHWPIKNSCFLTHPSGLDVYLLYNVDRLSEMCHQTNMKFHQCAEAASERSIVVEKRRSQTDLMDFSTERENLMALWRDSALRLVGKSVKKKTVSHINFRYVCDVRSHGASLRLHRQNAMKTLCLCLEETRNWWN